MAWLWHTPEALLKQSARKKIDDRSKRKGPANYVKFKDLNKSFILKPGLPFYSAKRSVQMILTE